MRSLPPSVAGASRHGAPFARLTGPVVTPCVAALAPALTIVPPVGGDSSPRLPASSPLSGGIGEAVILLGHGSVVAGSGASMLRTAAELQRRGLADRVLAAFLNFTEPSFAHVAGACIASGAERLVVVPYFLVAGKYVRVDVPRLIHQVAAAYPHVEVDVTTHLANHPVLADMARFSAEERLGRPISQSDAVVLLCHGSPDDTANDDVRAITARLRTLGIRAEHGCMELNRPTIGEAIAAAIAGGAATVIAVPYFLHLGRHVRADLPVAIAEAQRAHPAARLLLAEHLGDDARLATVAEERVRAFRQGQRAAQEC